MALAAALFGASMFGGESPSSGEASKFVYNKKRRRLLRFGKGL